MIRRLLAYGWPTVLVAAACTGLVASNWVRPGAGVCAVGLLCAVAGAARCEGPARVALLAIVMALAGAWWGGVRLAALDRSVLSAHIGERAVALVTVTGPVRRGTFTLRMPAEVRRFGVRSVREAVLLELPHGRAPPQGALLELEVRPVAPRGPETGFDERGWLARRGVHVVLRGRSPRLVGRRGGIGGVADRLHRRVASALASGASGERLALLQGVVLGDDDGLTPELKADFKAAGLYHLLAVSGQNVAFIAWGVLGLAWVLGVPRALAHVAVLGAIGAYALAVGWQPSVVRAAVAGALASLAWLGSRPRDRWHFLALGALVLLAWSPATIFDAGFQLSFAAVAAIFVWVPWLDRRLAFLPLPFELPRPLRGTIAVSIACGTVTSPLLWLDFRAVPLWTVVANALAEPAVGPLLGLGLLAALVAPVLPPAAVALAWLAGWAAAWIALSARLVAALPFAQVSSAYVLLLLAASTAALVVVKRLPRWRRRGALAVLAVLVLVGGSAWWARSSPSGWTPPGGARFTFLDVGQGDAELLEVPQGAVLVDTGPPEADLGRQLRRLGVRSLSAVVLTHPHRDHVGGLPSVLSHVHVVEVLDPRQPGGGADERAALESAREDNVPVVAARAGQVLRVGGLVLRVVWPDGGGLRGDDPHLHAVVLLASFGATDLLLTADAESNVTSALHLPPVEILKVAHHGSADPGLPDLLRRLRPRVAVIEVGAHNDYGHPRAETLAALAASPGLRLYRTDRNGRVVVESDGRSFSVRTERGVGSGT